MTHPNQRTIYRKQRVRQKIQGTSLRPRLSVYRSTKYIYAQVIDDTLGRTLAHVSSLDEQIKGQKKCAKNTQFAQQVGKLIAKKMLDLKIKKVVFDRGGRRYHGVVKSIAESARAGGLEF